MDFSFDLLIVSPLKRALETYVHSNIKVHNVIISDLFQELKIHNSNMLDNVDHSKMETIEELDIRTQNALNFLMSLPYENIGVISHHDFLNYFFKKKFDKDVSLDNCQSFFIETVI